MSIAANVATNFLNQNFYGFCLLLIAAFFFYHKMNEAAQAFSYIGSALMGIRQLMPQAPATIQTGIMENTTVNESKDK
jgi:hypothetical protein